MKASRAKWQPAAAHSSSLSAPTAFCLRKMENLAETPISQQVLSWMLFWPLPSQIARHGVYFARPAPAAADYQNGAAIGSAFVGLTSDTLKMDF
jgi:hypothetical protein